MPRAISPKATTLRRGGTPSGAKPPGFKKVIRLLSWMLRLQTQSVEAMALLI